MSSDNLIQLGSFSTPDPPRPVFEIDPVCKMRVMPETAAAQYTFEGKTYYFCATRCQQRFAADPRSFLNPAPKTEAAKGEAPRGVYTCPMHPEIRQNGPGACP